MDVLRTPHPFPDIAASHLWLCICIDTLRSCQVQGILADWQGDHASVMLTKRLFCICLCPGILCLWHPAPPIASLPLTGSYTTTGWPTKFTPPQPLHVLIRCWYEPGPAPVAASSPPCSYPPSQICTQNTSHRRRGKNGFWRESRTDCRHQAQGMAKQVYWPARCSQPTFYFSTLNSYHAFHFSLDSSLNTL